MSTYKIMGRHEISNDNGVMDTNYLNHVTTKEIKWIFSSLKNNKQFNQHSVIFKKSIVSSNNKLIKHQNFVHHIWNLAKKKKISSIHNTQ